MDEYRNFAAPSGGLFDNPQATKPKESLRESKQAKRDAYRRNRGAMSTQAKQVLAAIQSAGGDGVTRQEIADSTGLKLSTVCGRVNDLLNAKDDAGELAPQIFVKGRRSGSGVCFARGYC